MLPRQALLLVLGCVRLACFYPGIAALLVFHPQASGLQPTTPPLFPPLPPPSSLSSIAQETSCDHQ